MISCILTDLDGTLIDSSAANVAAYAQAFQEVGLSFDADLYLHQFGLRYPEMMRIIAPGATPQQSAQIKELKAAYYKNHMSLIRLNTGLIALLGAMAGAYKIALVTTASRVNVENLLEFFSLKKGLFDTVIAGEDVHVGKPHPECYQTAMQRLNKKPDECCIFEDSDVGIEAATRSGAKVIRVKL